MPLHIYGTSPEKANRVTASAFLVALVKAVPYKIHTVLTDNGIQFRLPPRQANAPNARYMTHMFALRCREHGIEHRFTKINHPWTNGQVERMNRTIRTLPSNAILRRSRPVAPPSRRLRRRLQFRTPSEDPQRPHAIRVRLKMLDFRARPIQTQPTPSNAGTEQLVMRI